jgi:hypothetical protein
MSHETCNKCRHFIQLFGEKRGECYGPPPVMDTTGASPPPRVFPSRRACSLFSEIPEGQAPAVKSKVQADTPGRAAQLRREERRHPASA